VNAGPPPPSRVAFVDNAGLREATAAQPWSADPDDWWDIVEVNVRGPMLLAQAVIPGMLKRGAGRILELASGLGLRAEQICQTGCGPICPMRRTRRRRHLHAVCSLRRG
jgi:NAD(P)-dependent dehydrogenase (short-subunit alcohol dehydrogenase family)